MCIIGNTKTCANGDSSNADAILNIGGRYTTDDGANPPIIDISHAMVYNRVIAKWEIEDIQVTLGKAGKGNAVFEILSVLTAA